MRRIHRLAWVLALILAAAAMPVDAGKKKPKKNTLARPHEVGSLDGPATLENVNERWRGAVTQTRVNVPIHKGKSRGWSSSEWLAAEEEVLKVRFSVSPREKLGQALPKKNLLAGVTMVCDGWTVQKPKKGRGIQIDFRFVNYPAKARLEFDTDVEHLAEVERFLRANLLGVTRYASAEPTTASTASATPRPLPTVESRLDEATSYASPPPPKQLKITGATVHPMTPRRGDAVELRITYEVSGGDDSIVSVHESRSLLKGSAEIASLDEVFDRPPGRYTSTLALDVPGDALPGFYSYHASVRFEDLADQFSAVFEVR